jgi:hypothetical protein
MIESHPGMKKEIIATLTRAQNFFKHADWDPEAELDFDETGQRSDHLSKTSRAICNLPGVLRCSGIWRQASPSSRLDPSRSSLLLAAVLALLLPGIFAPLLADQPVGITGGRLDRPLELLVPALGADDQVSIWIDRVPVRPG